MTSSTEVKAEAWTAANCAKLLAALTPEAVEREERWFRRCEIRRAARARRKSRGWR